MVSLNNSKHIIAPISLVINYISFSDQNEYYSEEEANFKIKLTIFARLEPTLLQFLKRV